jgi:hypothetical protein
MLRHLVLSYIRTILLFTVDKIIISQESVATFINEIRPGAYASMTKVRACLWHETTHLIILYP